MPKIEKKNELMRLAKAAQDYDLQKALDEQLSYAKEIILYGAGNFGRHIANLIKSIGGGTLLNAFLTEMQIKNLSI